MRASPEIMSPILLCWHTKSEVDIAGVVVTEFIQEKKAAPTDVH